MDKYLKRQSIRDNVRMQRRMLTKKQQYQYAKMLALRALKDKRIQRANKLAIFLSFDNEINTNLLINMLWKETKIVYLPVLHPFAPGHLLFMQYNPNTPLVINRLNIYEPQLDVTTLLLLNQLDICFIPLVAFDNYGNRLGMGGGFYDRMLYSWYTGEFTFCPIGLAYDCQYQTEAIPTEKWDIPLPEVITPSCHWHWNIALK
ncbi:5-formyltetrahydrofolate cyclo-ligase [Candidatus Palibaumannia cicadellinicola]|uniref:5-formyltetrahydrofolate cyclo-ligase n=1 Tax=Baumannia cicadellinicola subsp. Homalodisca coagulata TaxID=374463 RepID=Q1LSJ3_BAUCH|nr:5-formyltetrahydrofolate cyclo-ligase [Candidatus Baumannia cicadellinicola]ABF13837.1 5-formyltetrahydrofolate cyclo-ligase family protein [Baumannia cicadellinicola str. Hc (Homalodisca coagulata)]MCJ7461985.1 5-formyltetrahydrofolate cyclo-ligase [Candidatus Baumannia cicadellinicola]MCJ7462771.1 5-formyltetrahydrofolate cyclo-ligase [Candidatus Baumannia cicadellinicola]